MRKSVSYVKLCLEYAGLQVTSEIKSEWSLWSKWSECDSICGGGSKWRRRECHTAGSKNCQGHAVEKSICNTHSCQGKKTYTCQG